MIRTVSRRKLGRMSAGNVRVLVIVMLLLVSVGVGAWTFWPDLQRLILPTASALPPSPATATIPVSPQSAPPKVPNTQEGAKGLTLQPARLPVPVKEPVLNLVEENVPTEPSILNQLPEKLNTVSVGKKVPSRAEERAKMMAEEAKKDITARTREFLQDAEIAGVRLAGKMSRLLFNGRVYEIGDMVGSEIKVRITKMTSTEITFEDQQGRVYPIHY